MHFTTVVVAALATLAAAAPQGNRNGNANVANAAAAAGNVALLAQADFGVCTPTMDFVFGRPGRKPDEATFLPVDDLVAQGQQDALNPNIITNRICDQLTNVCDANDAAKEACANAQAFVESLGTRDATTAAAFNAALGF